MSHVGQAYFTGSVHSASLAIAVRPATNIDPQQYINVRLVNGDAFYTAGGTSVSGGAVLTADQGAPALHSSAWPVKLSDGSSTLAVQANPAWVTGSVYVLNPAAASESDVTTLSGSVVGLLVGGAPHASTNPIWVTGSVGVTNAGPSQVTALSGSVSGLLVGGLPVSQTNPVPVATQGTTVVTGSVTLTEVAAITGTVVIGRAVDVASLPNVTVANPQTTVTTLSGSVVGLLVGGQPHSSTNQVWVTGSVSLAREAAVSVTNLPATQDVTGSVVLARAVDVATMPAVTQGTAASLSAPWPVIVVSGSDPVGTQTHPTWVTGSVYVLNPSGGVGSNVVTLSGSVEALQVAGLEVGATNPLPTYQPFATATASFSATGGANYSTVLDVRGLSSVGYQVSSSADFTGSVWLYASLDGGQTWQTSVDFPFLLQEDGYIGGIFPSIDPAYENVNSVGSVSSVNGVTHLMLTGTCTGGDSFFRVTATNSKPGQAPWAGSYSNYYTYLGEYPPMQAVLIGAINSSTDALTALTVDTNKQLKVVPSIPYQQSENAVTTSVSRAVIAGVGTDLEVHTPTLHDLNTAGGEQWNLGVNLRRSNSGGSAELLGPATSANAIPVTIATDQSNVAVSGTVRAVQSTPAGLDSPWPVLLVSGSDAIGTATHPIYVRELPGSSAAVSSLTASVTSQLLLATNSSRLSCIVFNDSSANLYLKFGSVASLSSFTYKVLPGGTLEIPRPSYSGRIDVIWDAASGNARITEVT
jgi:hypothetical protein